MRRLHLPAPWAPLTRGTPQGERQVPPVKREEAAGPSRPEFRALPWARVRVSGGGREPTCEALVGALGLVLGGVFQQGVQVFCASGHGAGLPGARAEEAERGIQAGLDLEDSCGADGEGSAHRPGRPCTQNRCPLLSAAHLGPSPVLHWGMNSPDPPHSRGNGLWPEQLLPSGLCP